MKSEDYRRLEKHFLEMALRLESEGMDDSADKFRRLAVSAEADAIISGRYERQGYDPYTLKRVRADGDMTTEDRIVVSLIWLVNFCLIGVAFAIN